MDIKDSGNRRSFESGAVRDIAEGKGRCDLLPLLEVASLFDEAPDSVLFRLYRFVSTKDSRAIYAAIHLFLDKRGWTVSDAILEVSKQYEGGATKYGEHNWEKGIPLHCYLDSGIRHYLKWVRGDDDEPHDRAFLWNMLGLLWTFQRMPELDDILQMG